MPIREIKSIGSLKNLNCCIKINGSKSISHRALILAALSEGRSELYNLSLCEDVIHTIKGLESLGIKIQKNGDTAYIDGSKGCFSLHSVKSEIFLGNSGTSYRFLCL